MTNLKTKDFEGILSEIIKNFVRMSFLVETSNDFTAIVQFQKLLMEFSRLKIEAGFNTKEQGTLDMNEVFERINKALERRRAYSAQNSSAAKAQSAYSGPG